MRKIYLFLVLSLAMMGATQVSAQTWTEPTEPTTGSDPVSGHVYRVKNVEADMCVTGGRSFFSWATTAVLAESGAITWTMEYDEAKAGWSLKGYDGGWPGCYLFVSGNNIEGYAMHVDNATDTHRYYELIKQNNGYYRVRCVASDDTYGNGIENYENRFWGWMPDGEYANGMYAAVNPDEGFACDWEFIDMSTYVLQQDLYALTVTIVENGYNVDYSAYETAYNSGNYDQVKAAYEELSEKVNQARIYAALAYGQDGVNPPSEENPCNATSLIVNPDFSTGNINGWTCTFRSGVNATNVGYQSSTHTNGDVQISQFIEAWSGNNYNANYNWKTIGDGELSQTL